MRVTTRSIVRSLTIVVVGLAASSSLLSQPAKPTIPHYAGAREDAAIPRPGMTPQKGRVAVVVTDPQNGFLSAKGVAWAKLPGFDGYEAAFVNFRVLASDVWSTAQAVRVLSMLK